jgi:isoleucyl-tRNA synthetase
MPWCTRCGTSISQHEMLDAYAELTHESVTVALPLLDRPDHRLLVWTTTPWTLPANVAVAVQPQLDYAECVLADTIYYVAAGLVGRYPTLGPPRRTVKGAELVGLRYEGPFDDVALQRGIEHRVIPWADVSAEEGTGIVHIAPGCGLEDFDLGRRDGLPVIAPVDPEGRYLDGLGSLSGTPVVDAAAPIAACEGAPSPLRAGFVPPSLSHLLAVWPGADLPRRGRVVPQRRRDSTAGPGRQRARHVAPGLHAAAHGRLARQHG